MNLGQLVTLLEKSRYPFRVWPKEPAKTVLFPGCSFPAQFPKTMDALEALCKKNGVAVAYDCCGKPLDELGRKKDVRRVETALQTRLDRLGAERVLVLCPNCGAFLKGRLRQPVISVYRALEAWGVSSPLSPPAGVLFRPCPDRASGEMLAEIGGVLPLDRLHGLSGVPCCGLRGDIMAHGPRAGAKLCALVREKQQEETLYTYCASCSGQFARQGCPRVVHLLSVLLGVEEAPDSTHALRNRAARKFEFLRRN